MADDRRVSRSRFFAGSEATQATDVGPPGCRCSGHTVAKGVDMVVLRVLASARTFGQLGGLMCQAGPADDR